MRHRVRLRWRDWEHIGASGQVVNWIRHGVRVKFKHGLRPKPFNHGVSKKDATQPQLDFHSTEVPRFEACGAWECAYHTRDISRMFLVPKPGVNKWRLILKLKLILKLFTTCTVCAGLQQVPYAPVAVSWPSQQCHTRNLQVRARPLTT
jgi:hypothetical protein